MQRQLKKWNYIDLVEQLMSLLIIISENMDDAHTTSDNEKAPLYEPTLNQHILKQVSSLQLCCPIGQVRKWGV